jgi:acyl-CoA thioesterase-1
VGDSLTAGLGLPDESQAYPALLEVKLAAAGYNWRVVNAGVSGETSSGTLSRIEWVISSLQPDIVILETGANDGLRGIDPDVLRANLDAIVTILKKNDIRVVLAGMRMLPNLGPDYIEKFAAVYPEIARKHDILLIPFFLEGVAGEPALNQPDRLHPTAEGYARIVETVYPFVQQAIDAIPD